MTKEQEKSFEEATRPLIKWLNENSNPHAYVTVDTMGAELFSGVMVFKTEEYLRD